MGKPLSEEHKEALRNARTGTYHSFATIIKMSQARKGIPKTEEHKEKIREAVTAAKARTDNSLSKEHKAKISASLLGNTRRRGKIVKTERIRLDENGCHLWLLGKDKDGYGLVKHKGVSKRAHRYYWELKNGKIPPNFQLHHICEIKSCVNPDHLKLATAKSHRREHSKISLMEISHIKELAIQGYTANEIKQMLSLDSSLHLIRYYIKH